MIEGKGKIPCRVFNETPRFEGKLIWNSLSFWKFTLELWRKWFRFELFPHDLIASGLLKRNR
jgi:hypothetical protein